MEFFLNEISCESKERKRRKWRKKNCLIQRERESRVTQPRRLVARPSAYRRRWLFPLSIQSSSTLCASIRWPFRYISESGLGFVPGRVLLMESFNRRQILLFWIRSEVVGRRLVATGFRLRLVFASGGGGYDSSVVAV